MSFWPVVAFFGGIMVGGIVSDFTHDDSMRHSWIVEHYDCRKTDETRVVLGVTEVKWDCRKQDAFWRPISE